MTEPIEGYQWTQESHDAIQAGLPGGGINKLTQLAMGNDQLVTNPGLLSAVNNANATPEQAQAINNFMDGLDLEKQVHLNRASGTKMTLNYKQQNVLDQMGVDYSDVSQTEQQANDSFASQLQSKGLQVVKDADGSPILNPDGSPQVQKLTAPSKKHGWSFGRILGDVGNGVLKGWNTVDASATKIGNDLNITGRIDKSMGVTVDPLNPLATTPHDTSAQQAQYAKDAGYDPSSFFSMIAYEASGKSHINLSHLATDWDSQSNGSGISGTDALNQAIQFSTNPDHYRQSIENDPDLDVTAKAAKLNFIGSQAFSDLVKQVQGSTATLGNVAAQSAGLDPVKNPSAYKIASAGSDFAASLIADPAILAGKAFSALRAAQVGITDSRGVIDGNKIRAIFTPLDSAGKASQPFVAGVQRRWADFLTHTQTIASDSASDVEKAQAYRSIQSRYPEMAPMTEQFTGANRVVGFDSKAGTLVYGTTKPITTLEEAGDYLASSMAQVAASQGKAALESSLMPGSTSLFGFRALKGAMAGSGHAVKINLARIDKATSILPSADEAIDAAGHVMSGADPEALQNLIAKMGDSDIAETLKGHLATAMEAAPEGDITETLASAKRAAMNDPVLKGQVQHNMLLRGTPSGDGFNLFGMVKARGELVTRRLSSLLPRNTEFKLNDAATTENIYRYAQIYMNKGDAALMAARWTGGDEATRRALISHLQLQTAHSAGFGFTESGRKALDEMSSLLDNGTTAFGGEKSTAQRFTGDEGKDIGEDPALGGRAAHYAIHFDQAIDGWRLPSFAQLQQNAQRFGLWDRILGKAFTSQTADTLMHGFKMIQLFKPSTFTRNMVEGWANAVFRGDAAGGIRAKALGVEVEKRLADEITAKGTAEGLSKDEIKAQIAAASPLQKKGFITSKIPHLIMGQWYRSALNTMMGDDLESQYILKLLDKPGEAQRMMAGYGLQHLRADVDPAGLATRLGAHEDGFGAAQLSFGANTQAGKKIESWEASATDGFDGAAKYSNALAIRLQSRPAYSKLLLDAAKSDDGNIAPLLDEIAQSPELERAARQMRFSSLYQDSDGKWVQAVTPAERQIALEQLVRKQVSDVKYMMTGQDGTWAQGIEDQFRTAGKVPDGTWIQKNITGDARPKAVEAPVYAAVPLKPGVNGFINSIFEKVDKGYVRMVEDPIQRTTSMPLFLHSYGQARTRFSQMEQDLIHVHGFTEEAADNLMQEAAMKQAWVKTESMIDDPGLKAQFDIVGRNFFAYSRATQAMIRRWGQTLIQDPTRIVKGALAVQAAEHAGVIWTDENGEPNFTFPGSGAFIHLFTDAMSHVPILGGFMQIPTVPDLTGKVMLSVPGLENPAKLSATPLVNVPFRAIERLIPEHRGLMDEIDRTVNGPIGAGEISTQFQPVALKKFFDAHNENDRNGMTASATIGALTNLIAAGKVPGPDATADEQQRFIENVKTNVRNQLYLRAVFGLWAPAPPSSPTNATSASAADEAFAIDGIHGLDSEFKTMLNDMGGDYAAAAQLWTAMHPDKLVYTQAKSGSTANKAYLPATQAALDWTTSNVNFIKKYPSIAGYFLPESDGAFDSSAYATQLALGLREKKTPKEFLDTALINIARPEYDATTTSFDQKIAAAKAANDTDAAKQLTASRAAYVTDFNARNPLWKQQGAEFEVKANTAQNALTELRQMVADKSTPGDVPKQVISEMLQSWDTYQQWKANNPANTTAQKDARTLMASAFGKFMSEKAQQVPGLIDVYQGIFRQLDNKLTDLSADN